LLIRYWLRSKFLLSVTPLFVEKSIRGTSSFTLFVLVLPITAPVDKSTGDQTKGGGLLGRGDVVEFLVGGLRLLDRASILFSFGLSERFERNSEEVLRVNCFFLL